MLIFVVELFFFVIMNDFIVFKNVFKVSLGGEKLI